MRCQHCHSDSDDPCIPDEAFDRAVEYLDQVGQKIDDDDLSLEEVEDLYGAADANALAADEEDEDEISILSGPHDLSNEECRVYHFLDDVTITVDCPETMYVMESGEHWITAEDGEVGVVVPPCWIKYEIFPLAGQKPFGIGE